MFAAMEQGTLDAHPWLLHLLPLTGSTVNFIQYPLAVRSLPPFRNRVWMVGWAHHFLVLSSYQPGPFLGRQSMPVVSMLRQKINTPRKR